MPADRLGPKRIPVIDIFAGPGGLSHGFAAYKNKNLRFDIRLSIEKDEVAWRTLLLRAFLHQFKNPPPLYFSILKGGNSKRLDDLAKAFPAEWASANNEARQWTLGEVPFADVSSAIGAALGKSKDWVLLGGPPCQAYSLAGRVRMKNAPAFSTDARHTLYREYLKIVAVHQPMFFVMENVKGILSSVHGTRVGSSSVFTQILEDLRNPGAAVEGDPEVSPFLPMRDLRFGYTIHSFVANSATAKSLEPSDYVIRSEEWGIPQKRHRVILFGVRSDVHAEPYTLLQLFSKETVHIEQVIGSMPKLRSRISGNSDSAVVWADAVRAVLDKKTTDQIANPAILKRLRQEVHKIRSTASTGSPYKAWQRPPSKLAKWLWDKKLGGVIQHETRSHMASDLRRYVFAACAAIVRGNVSPKLGEFPKLLLPKHKNASPKVEVGNQKSKKKKADFEDRFRVQVRKSAATTITSHISKDGHYYIHYDPTQCRSLTVREAARIQTFPDSYYFHGKRTKQFHQVGNAVPPLLAHKLAKVLATTMQSEFARRRAVGGHETADND